MDAASLLLDLDCPCPDFGGEIRATARQLLALMPWLGVVTAKQGDIAAVVQMALDDDLTAIELAETLGSSVPTAYRLAARNKAWLMQARQLEELVRASRAGEGSLFDSPLTSILLPPRLRAALTRGSVSKKEHLTVRRFRDHWSFEHLQRVPCFDLVGMENLAKSLALAGLQADFDTLIGRILAAGKRRCDFEVVLCELPEKPRMAPGQAKSGTPAGHRYDFLDRAAAAQREFAWGAVAKPLDVPRPTARL